MLSFDANGHPRNDLYQDVYKSRAGAMSEARKVFVEGAKLPELFAAQNRCTVLELGFGLGVNFLATLAAWRQSARPGARLHFVSIERHLLDVAQIARAHEALGLNDQDARELRDYWPLASPGLHRITLHQGRVCLLIAHGDLLFMLPRLRLRADAIFLDGFAPERNPQMWSLPALKAVGRLAAHNARLATYSSAHQVRENLSAAGFEVMIQRGYGGKRRRLEARYAPRRPATMQDEPARATQDRRAVIIGAGLAGCAIAERIARNGWSVTVLEQSTTIGGQAANQPVIADHLHVSTDDNPTARLTRAALLLDRQHNWTAMQRRGRLQVAGSVDEVASNLACVDKLSFPRELLQYADRQSAESLTGARLRHGGMWMPACRHADPVRLCAQWLQAAAGKVELRTGVQIDRIEQHADGWRAIRRDGQLLASAPVMVLANAADGLRLAGLPTGSLRRVRGQTTRLAAQAFGELRSVLGGDAYACPMQDGDILVGSTFDDDDDPLPRPACDLSNLRRLARMVVQESGNDRQPHETCSAVPEPTQGVAGVSADPASIAPASLQMQADLLAEHFYAHARSGGVGFRYASRDRLPMIGAIPDLDRTRAAAGSLSRNAKLPIPVRSGLYGALGFGSRGLLWSRLAAETIAAMLDNEPIPLESDLLDAIDPARFLRQALRRSRDIACDR
jgi:tRNA 5-methylaminomethyl-2-thiouridine biosynthesis bifunctional protein